MANFCPNCGMATDSKATQCPGCKANLRGFSNNNANFSNQNNNQKKKGLSGCAIALIICSVFMAFFVAVIGILAAIAIPNFKKARENAIRKACYSNQRVLMGAVEMYNMDHNESLESLDIPKLIKEHYCKPITAPDPKCSYTSEGNFSEGGYIKCKHHGSVFKQ